MFRIYENDMGGIVLHFEPNDGSQYMVHVIPDIDGGLLLASTYASKGLYRWIPDNDEVYCVDRKKNGYSTDYFTQNVLSWFKAKNAEGRSIAEIVLEKWS